MTVFEEMSREAVKAFRKGILSGSKMSKSNSNKANIDSIDDKTKISALKSEVKYWKTRHSLLERKLNISNWAETASECLRNQTEIPEYKDLSHP